MTDKETLEKAIKKAQLNGFMPDHRFDYSKDMGWTYVLREKPEQTEKGLTVNVTGMLSESDLIYNNEFAKALWPNETNWYATSAKLKAPYTEGIREWQYHLQQLVISENPLQYLKENI